MTTQQAINELETIVGSKNILTQKHKTERYRKGFRSGEGDALAVIFPTTLLAQWQALEICVKYDIIIIMQAANTGLTEGSTPNGNAYGRDVIILNTSKMDQLHILDDGKQIISFPGTTLYTLEKQLNKYNREPHSVIGSSCIGASIIGGVCNNSGGALVKNGPAFTQLSLHAKINEDGTLELVNHLGINLGGTPKQILTNLQSGNFSTTDFIKNNLKASDNSYAERVRDVNADTPARFNADKRNLFEASGCAGKLVIFAVRLDTYEKNRQEQVYYIGTNNVEELTKIRRDILEKFKNLPVLAEYMHKDIYDISKKYGKDVFLIINLLGTDYLPAFFTIKGNLDAWFNKIKFLPNFLTDKVMQMVGKYLPNILPKSIEDYRKRYDHYLILKMADDGIGEADTYLNNLYKSDPKTQGDFIKCSANETKKILLHRFVAAGSAIRYEAVHNDEVETILALDVAFKRNEKQWSEQLPKHIEDKISHKLYYGHFMCHVFHQDYIVKKDVDVAALKQEMLDIFDEKGAEYPAEHNVGHIYAAKPDLAKFYKSLDPTNSLNPGIGKMSKIKNYQ